MTSQPLQFTIRTVAAKPARKPLWRKIGGIHWLSLGRIRISFCLTATAVATTAQACPSGPLWELQIERSGQVYIEDTQLTLSDCAAAAIRYRRTHERADDIICAPMGSR